MSQTVVPPPFADASPRSEPGGSAAWRDTPVAERARRLGRLRHVLADEPSPLLDALRSDTRDDATTLSAEVLPLADAARWLVEAAPRVLQTRRLGLRGRPQWLFGVAAEVRREPMGTVLIIGPGNFPLFLPGVQALHALAAGNTVLIKPAPGHGCVGSMTALRRMLVETCGLPPDALIVLDPATEALDHHYDHADLIVLTGSEATGRAVRQAAAERGIPCIMELSGCDAAIILDTADLDTAARCVRFGMMLNASRTCIAPRRAVVVAPAAERFVERLVDELATQPAVPIDERLRQRVNRLIAEAVEAGAAIRCGAMPDGDTMAPTVLTGVTPGMGLADADLFAPVLSVIEVDDADAAVHAVHATGFGLGRVGLRRGVRGPAGRGAPRRRQRHRQRPHRPHRRPPPPVRGTPPQRVRPHPRRSGPARHDPRQVRLGPPPRRSARTWPRPTPPPPRCCGICSPSCTAKVYAAASPRCGRWCG